MIWSAESSFTMFSTNGRVHVWCQPKDFYNPECLVLTVKGSGGSVMLWGTFSWHCLDAVLPFESKVNANHYLMVLSDHLHPVLQHFFPARRGVSRMTMPPSTEHMRSPNGLMTMTLMLSINHGLRTVTRSDPNRAFTGYSGTTPDGVSSLHQTSAS